MVRGIRGAITVDENSKQKIIAACARLVKAMQEANGYQPDDISHIIITATQDLTAAFPAQGLREVPGYDLVPVMCAQEIPVPDSLEKCIRVMATINTNKQSSEIHHIYLEKAVKLRPDLVLTNKCDSR
ncbi:MAG: chorismate mutase [Bacillus sp. (in: Bacteria)]|nr:chorismate mutase [Bacillus sp. (in: firmicutes)]